MLRYEVITPAGHAVAVPHHIWHAWPPSDRRLLDVTDTQAAELAAKGRNQTPTRS